MTRVKLNEGAGMSKLGRLGVRPADTLRGRIKTKLIPKWVHLGKNDYDPIDRVEEVTEERALAENARQSRSNYYEQIVTSQLPNGRHIFAIDIDHPCELVPSRTEGHYHLYVDIEMDFEQLHFALLGLSKAGVVERGYVEATKANGFTVLRVPTAEIQMQRLKRDMEQSGQIFPDAS